jgi:hypothetical protein
MRTYVIRLSYAEYEALLETLDLTEKEDIRPHNPDLASAYDRIEEATTDE